VSKNMLRWDAGLKTETQASHKIQLRVRYSEVDSLGIVYHVNHLNYFELARSAWIREKWMSYQKIEESGFGFVVTNAQIKYISPIYYDEVIEIIAILRKIERTRVIFDYEILRKDNQKLLCNGITELCYIDKHKKPTRIPEQMKEILN